MAVDQSTHHRRPRPDGLRALDAVTSYGDFRLAAASLDTEASELATAIVGLEATVGAELIDRSTPEVHVTPKAHDLLQHVVSVPSRELQLPDRSRATGTLCPLCKQNGGAVLRNTRTSTDGQIDDDLSAIDMLVVIVGLACGGVPGLCYLSWRSNRLDRWASLEADTARYRCSICRYRWQEQLRADPTNQIATTNS